MKYQVILNSVDIIPDDEFENNMMKLFELTDLVVIEARSLDGIKEELYQKQEKIIDGILHVAEPSRVVERSFEDISKLFNLD